MIILSIDTSCDETSVAITEGRRVLSNVIYSQVLIHKKWGGVVPSLAKWAHEERIDFVIAEALKKYRGDRTPEVKEERSDGRTSGVNRLIDFIAVTQGPGLAVALEVGINKAKELARKFNKKIIAVNHMEGHIYSSFVQNRNGNPKREFQFPYLALLISGGHTELVIFKNHIDYEVIGQTIDDAAGEALDKAAKMLGLGYPGGAVIERLAEEVDNQDFYKFPRPMLKSNDLNFSFSGLKTAFYYFTKRSNQSYTTTLSTPGVENKVTNNYHATVCDSKQTIEPPRLRRSNATGKPRRLNELASSFQEAVFDTLIYKTEKAIKKTGIKRLVVGGGVIANLYLRKKLRKLVKKHKGSVLFPPYKYLTGDNAAMIGVAAHFKAEKGIFVKSIDQLDRIPRLSL